MKLNNIKETLGADTLSLRNGIYTARWEFFYTHGVTSDAKAAKVERLLPGAKVIEHREIWKNFNGGASTANSSHWLVRFTSGSRRNPCGESSCSRPVLDTTSLRATSLRATSRGKPTTRKTPYG